MKDGRMVEAGYQYDLEASVDEYGNEGEFMRLARNQGILQSRDDDSLQLPDEGDIEFAPELPPQSLVYDAASLEVHQPFSHRLTMGASMMSGWMFDVVADLTKGASNDTSRISRALSPSRFSRAIAPMPRNRGSLFPPAATLRPLSPLHVDTNTRPRRPSSISIPSPLHLDTVSPFNHAVPNQSLPRRQRRLSLQFEPTTPTNLTFTDIQKQGLEEKHVLERSARSVNG